MYLPFCYKNLSGEVILFKLNAAIPTPAQI